MLRYVLLGYLAILSIYDIRFRSIPAWTVVIGGIIGGLNSVYAIVGCENVSWFAVLKMIAAMIPGMFMLLISLIGGNVGCGDGFVLLITGSVLAWNLMLAVYAVSLLMTAMAAMLLLAFRKSKREDRLPYLPFLAVAVLLVQ